MGVLTFAALSYVLRTFYRRLDRLGIFDTKFNEAHIETAWVEVSIFIYLPESSRVHYVYLRVAPYISATLLLVSP